VIYTGSTAGTVATSSRPNGVPNGIWTASNGKAAQTLEQAGATGGNPK
jgi:hypothetical protein